MKNSWLRATTSAWTLGIEASSVIALRMAKLAAGGKAAKTETRKMVSEKVTTAHNLGLKAMTGQLGHTLPSVVLKTTQHYLPKVKANKRRLINE